jgi:hypothetical protein
MLGFHLARDLVHLSLKGLGVRTKPPLGEKQERYDEAFHDPKNPPRLAWMRLFFMPSLRERLHPHWSGSTGAGPERRGRSP